MGKRRIEIWVKSAISNGEFEQMRIHFQALADIGFRVEVDGDEWEERYEAQLAHVSD